MSKLFLASALPVTTAAKKGIEGSREFENVLLYLRVELEHILRVGMGKCDSHQPIGDSLSVHALPIRWKIEV